MSSMTMPTPAVPDVDDGVPASRRRTELSMLALALGVTAFAFANVGFSLKGQHASAFVEYMVALIVITAAAHLAIRRWASYADPLLLPLATVLNGLGLVMMYRLSQAGKNGNPGFGTTGLSVPMSTSATTVQILYTFIGVACLTAVLALISEPRIMQRYTYILGIGGMCLFALPAFFSPVAGTNTRVQIAIGGFTLQPEEFGKVALAVSFAGYLVAHRDVLSLAGRRVLGIDLPRGRDLGPILVMWALSLLLLVFESDIGTSAVFMGLFVSMLYIATSRTSWMLIGFVLFVAGAVVASKLFSHVGVRVDCWLHPFAGTNPSANCFQPDQGLYGMANGGLLGKGLGGGQPYLTPLAQNDMVFTAFGEEVGLAGVMAMLLVYGLIVQRGLRTALMVKDPFSKLLAGGLSFMIALQVFVIVGGVTRVIPQAGLPTPFLSQGGSSLVATWIIIAILTRLSDTARRPPPRPIQEEGLTQVVSLK